MYVALLLDKADFTPDDVSLLANFIAIVFRDNLKNVVLDFKNVKTGNNTINLLYDKLFDILGYNSIKYIKLQNLNVNNPKIRVTPRYTQADKQHIN